MGKWFFRRINAIQYKEEKKGMNKKRLQRLGVACMAAAMVFTTVNFPSVAKADVGG